MFPPGPCSALVLPRRSPELLTLKKRRPKRPRPRPPPPARASSSQSGGDRLRVGAAGECVDPRERLRLDVGRQRRVAQFRRGGVTLAEGPADQVRHRAAEARQRNGNYIRLRLGPNIAIALGVRTKTPGEGMEGTPVELTLADFPAAGLDPYERLLGEAMQGDATLFARQDVVEAAWRIVDPVLRDGATLHEYECGSSGPPQADELVQRTGGWRCGE